MTEFRTDGLYFPNEFIEKLLTQKVNGYVALLIPDRPRHTTLPADLKTALSCFASSKLGGIAVQPNANAQFLAVAQKRKPRNCRFVAVKGAAAQKFSSGMGEQVKNKPPPDSDLWRSFVADAGYNP